MNSKLMNELQALDPSTRSTIALYSQDNQEAISSKVQHILADDLFMIRVRQIAWDLFRDKKIVDRTEIGNQVSALLDDTGLRDAIANCTIRILEKAVNNTRYSDEDRRCVIARSSQDETVPCIRAARDNWEVNVNEELLAVVSESRREYCVVRPLGSVNPKLELLVPDSIAIDLLEAAASGAASGGAAASSTAGTSTAAAASITPTPPPIAPPVPVPMPASSDEVRFLYDSEDLFESIIAIRNPNIKPAFEERFIGQIRVPLKTPDTHELCNRFAELDPAVTQFGVDDKSIVLGNKFCFSRHEDVEVMCSNNCCNIIDARKYLRRGCPPSCRNKLYRAALSLETEVSVQEQLAFAQLRLECDRLDLLTDDLYLHDVQTIIDDTRFFVFEEELKQIALCFSRDEWVRMNSLYNIHKPLSLRSHSNPGGIIKEHTSAPPAAVQPFAGLATYFAPLCYIYRDIVSLYCVCRAMYAQVWCKMNVISSDEGTLLHVCKTFESLLLANNSKLVFHLHSIGVPPLQIAMPWMQLGFVNLLEVDQVLILWDRLLGYNDTLILALLAVTIFLVRADNLLGASTAAEVHKLLSEGSRLKVVPLLQMLLPFPNSKVTSLTTAAKSVTINGIAASTAPQSGSL